MNVRLRYFDHRINYGNRKKKNGLKILPSFNSNDIFILVVDRELQDHIVVNEQFWHISSER